MAHLIQMRQRIKAIETIKKITHAMQLISMSTHARLKENEGSLLDYHQATSQLFETVSQSLPQLPVSPLFPDPSLPGRPLLILVGSQKGLCGNFNISLIKFFEKRYPRTLLTSSNNYTIISVGKKAIDYCTQHQLATIIQEHPNFNSSTLSFIAQTISRAIMQTAEPYSSVTIISNHLKTFFMHQPHTTQLIPFSLPISNNTSHQDYYWEQSPVSIFHDLAYQYIESHIYVILFQSLLAEQAARFLSMDSSTRNAKTLLEKSQLEYNKLRQATITKELTELTGSY